MVIKSKSWKTNKYGNLLKYMMKDSERIEGKFGFLLTHNIKGETPEEWDSQFKENESKRLRKRKDSVVLYHFILSFHVDDKEKLTPEILYNITQRFIEERSDKGMYVALPHLTDDHLHVHICASALEYKTGKSLRMSKTDFGRVKKVVQEYQIQRYPELEKSVVDHGACSRLREKQSREEIRRFLSKTLNHLFLMKTESNNVNLNDVLKQKGVEIYYRKGKEMGVIYNGAKHRYKNLENLKFDYFYSKTKEASRLSKIEKVRMSHLKEKTQSKI